MTMKRHVVGFRGCAGTARRRRGGSKPRPCAQPAIVTRGGKDYCWYHDPEDPRIFGGYARQDLAHKAPSP